MTVHAAIDRQGRLVTPLWERERLGLTSGGVLELVSTPEGILLERRHRAQVGYGDDGLPVVTVADPNAVSNDEVLAAIHGERERA